MTGTAIKWIMFSLLTLLSASCRSVQYVPVETVRTETVYQDRLLTKTDSVHLTDSIIIHEQGDTVFVERWRERWRERTLTDTVRIDMTRTDTVQVPYPVEKSLTRWQSFKQDAGGVAIGTLVAVMLFAAVWLIRRRRNA